MGIFNQINQRSGLVVGVIVVALLLFLLGDAFLSKNSFFNSLNNKVGEIDGSNVTIEEFQKAMAKAEALYGGSSNAPNLDDIAWNQIVFDKVNMEIYSKAGLEISENEKIDLIEGEHMSDIIKQQFQSAEGVQQFLKYLESDQIQSEEERENIKSRWRALKEYVYNERLRSKYENLIKKSEYVTKAEAERYYHSLNDKAEAEYVYVPYYSIKDTTITVTDEMMESYLKAHEKEFEVEQGRSIEFVVFNNIPTSEDSSYVKKDLNELKEEFKVAKNDSTFIRANSDVPADPSFVTISQLPPAMASMAASLQVDSVYGPFSYNNGFSLSKVIKIENDTNVMAKASHILFLANESDPAEKKAEAKKKAQQILAEIQGGANFEKMAAQYGGDGTASRGGDLGWFGKGQMVKPFENAIFNASKAGVLPSIVETQFGYHIIRIDVPKTGKKFLLASVQKEVDAFDHTIDSIYSNASSFAASVKDTATLHAELKKYSLGVAKFSQSNIEGSAKGITGVNEGREIIKWLYNDDRDVNDVSNVFTIDNKNIVVLVTSIREKGLAPLADVKDQIKPKVLIEEKAKKIKEKLSIDGKDLPSIAKAYGSDAVTGTATDIILSSGMITNVGFEPEAVGTLFGLAKDKTSEALTGENGVLILKKKNEIKSEVADYAQFVTQLQQQRNNRIAYGVIETAIKKTVEIEDLRYKN